MGRQAQLIAVMPSTIGMVISAFGFMEGICITRTDIMLVGPKVVCFTIAIMM